MSDCKFIDPSKYTVIPLGRYKEEIDPDQEMDLIKRIIQLIRQNLPFKVREPEKYKDEIKEAFFQTPEAFIRFRNREKQVGLVLRVSSTLEKLELFNHKIYDPHIMSNIAI